MKADQDYYRLRLNIYSKIYQAILENQSPEKVVDLVIESLTGFISYSQIGIALLNESGETATILSAKTENSDIEIAKGHVLPVSLFGDLENLRAGEHHKVNLISSNSATREEIDFLLSDGIHSFLVIPLITPSGLLGMLSVARKNEGNFNHEEIETLTEIGSQLALAISQAKLNEENKQQRDELSTLLNISNQLSQSIGLSKVMQIVIDQSTRVMGLETGAIYLLDGDKLFLGATTPPLPPDFPEKFRVALLDHHPHVKSAIARSQPVFLADTQTAELTPQEKEVSLERGLRSLLYSPLIVGSRTVGVLIMGTVQHTKEFLTNEIDLCRTFSLQMAMAVENSRLYKEAQLHAAEMERRVNERTAELEALTHAISHDLRAPLRAIRGFGKMLIQENSAALDGEGKQILARMVAASDRLEGMFEGLLSLTRIGRRKLKLEHLDLSEIASKILGEQCNAETKRSIDYTVNPCGAFCTSFYSDRVYLEILLSNLISNAIKFTHGENPAKIEFGCYEEDGKGIYFLRDNGIGFEIKHAPRIFAPFYRLNSAEEFSGYGIGLTVVKKIIDIHNGQIWVESEINKGTTIYFTIADLEDYGIKVTT